MSVRWWLGKGLCMRALPSLASLAFEIHVELIFPPTLEKCHHSDKRTRLNTCSTKHWGGLVNMAWEACLCSLSRMALLCAQRKHHENYRETHDSRRPSVCWPLARGQSLMLSENYG